MAENTCSKARAAYTEAVADVEYGIAFTPAEAAEIQEIYKKEGVPPESCYGPMEGSETYYSYEINGFHAGISSIFLSHSAMLELMRKEAMKASPIITLTPDQVTALKESDVLFLDEQMGAYSFLNLPAVGRNGFEMHIFKSWGKPLVIYTWRMRNDSICRVQTYLDGRYVNLSTSSLALLKQKLNMASQIAYQVELKNEADVPARLYNPDQWARVQAFWKDPNQAPAANQGILPLGSEIYDKALEVHVKSPQIHSYKATLDRIAKDLGKSPAKLARDIEAKRAALKPAESSH